MSLAHAGIKPQGPMVSPSLIKPMKGGVGAKVEGVQARDFEELRHVVG